MSEPWVYTARVGRSTRAPHRRAVWDRTNMTGEGPTLTGFKGNTPDGWVETNGPVWWIGSDRAYLAPQSAKAGRSAVTRASNLIVNRIAAAPWQLSGGAPPPRWVSDPMLTRPDDRYPFNIWPAAQKVGRSVFWGAWIRSALMWGMGYLIFVPDSQGQPNAGSLRILNPGSVGPAQLDPTRRDIQVDSGQAVTTDADGMFAFPGGQRVWRLLELRNPTTPLDTYTGCTPGTLAYHAAELGLIDAQISYAAGMYGGGGVPSGYLKITAPAATQEQADALRDAWMTSHGSGTRQVAVLNATVDYQAIAVSPVDAALADMKRLSLTDVANAFGVPGYLIGAPVVGMTYSNVQMELDSLYEFTLAPWAEHVQETLSALLPAGTDLDIHPKGEGPDVPAIFAAGGGVPAAVGPADVPAG